ncbi:YbaN family protein [Bacillus piscicola]|uniref:YbaN family protein n=1 Tax=Bacillus piscicola TaxID=1632684 RepID=UPI001F099E15|nr:YbaN family protein [Bacillus piscicola]
MSIFKKYMLIVLGSMSVALGVIGIILPLLPTTPFLLLAAYCYARSSNRLYERLLQTKWLGQYIQDFRSGKGIPVKSKVIALTVLWSSALYSILVLVPLLAVQILLFLVVGYISYYILSIKNKQKETTNHSFCNRQHS